MRTLLIEYDLRKPGKDYTELINAIRAVGTWCNHLKSAWMVRSAMTPVQMRDHLRRYMDASDALIVIDISGDAAAWDGIVQGASQWIQSNLV